MCNVSLVLGEPEMKHHMPMLFLEPGFQGRKSIVPFNRLNYTASDSERRHPGTLFAGKHLCSLLICIPPLLVGISRRSRCVGPPTGWPPEFRSPSPIGTFYLLGQAQKF